LKGVGNARGYRVGDLGSMHALGVRSVSSKEIYKGTLENAGKIKVASDLMRNWMEDKMPNTLSEILRTDKSSSVPGLLPCIPNGPGYQIMLSINLANSGHYDTADASQFVAIWVEEKPGVAMNWCFVLPNASYNGSKGVVIKLHHGVAISWDGRNIYHCTSKTTPGNGNNVFGCMWGSANR
jgi:hypothetical protein